MWCEGTRINIHQKQVESIKTSGKTNRNFDRECIQNPSERSMILRIMCSSFSYIILNTVKLRSHHLLKRKIQTTGKYFSKLTIFLSATLYNSQINKHNFCPVTNVCSLIYELNSDIILYLPRKTKALLSVVFTSVCLIKLFIWKNQFWLYNAL